MGIACAPSRLLVIDIDPRNGGDETFGALVRTLGELPTTWRAVTDGRGDGGDSSTVLFSPAIGTTLGGFHCSHAHCANRRLIDIVRMLAETINAGTYSPHTANGWLDVLRVIVKAAVVQFELPRNPMDGIRNFDTSEHGFTEEEPNSLTVQEMPPSCRRCGSSTRSTLLSSALASSWGTARRRCAARAPPRTFS